MDYSLYIHIPFCVHRCAYCDFNTYAGQEVFIPAYVEALSREIQIVAEQNPNGDSKVHTIYFGGGTPSLLTSKQFEYLLIVLRSKFKISDKVEISLEANPGTVSQEYLKDLHALGINRISFGVQSAHPHELRQLGRLHDFNDAVESIRWARLAGFDNLNLDLIFGLPGQSQTRWQETVKWTLKLNPEHFSLYALTIEPNTPLGRRLKRGHLPKPDSDLAAEMYEWAGELLENSGYNQYEISNWARPDYECRHNLQYWRNQPYLGFGAGAHGYTGSVRYSNVLRIRTYLQRLRSDRSNLTRSSAFSPVLTAYHALSKRVAMQEFMMTGLRLTHEGVSEVDFRERFGVELRQVFGEEIEKLVQWGLLEWVSVDIQRNQCTVSETILRLTRRGWLLGNQVFIRFVD